MKWLPTLSGRSSGDGLISIAGFVNERVPSRSARILVLTSIVDGFQDNIWMLDLTIESFLMGFKVREVGSSIALTAWMHCPDELIDSWDRDTISALKQNLWKTLDKYNTVFYDIELRCTGSMGDAYCTSAISSQEDFLLLLEHDWLFLPSRINHTLDDLMSAMAEDERIGSIRFGLIQQAVNEHCLEDVSVNEKMTLTRTSLYSNNPHIIKRVLAERIFGMHCRPTFMKEGHTTFELMGETFCQEQDCNAMRSGLSPCKLHRYGGTHYPQSLYHLDGKNFQKYRSMQTGIIFGNCSGRTQDFLDGTATISDYINHLDQRIATASNSKLCDPREDCPSCL
jgi:hypothetical protein